VDSLLKEIETGLGESDEYSHITESDSCELSNSDTDSKLVDNDKEDKKPIKRLATNYNYVIPFIVILSFRIPT